MKRNLWMILALSVGSLALLAQAPAPQQGGPDVDPNQPDGQYEPGRGVARISVLNGDVSVRRGDSGDVVAAAMNAPLMADDSLLTGSSSRAEVQLDRANMLRIAPNSEVRFAGVDIRSFQIQVASGTVTFRVLRPGEAQAEVDTPSVSVRPAGMGVYRVTVRDDGTSEITVRAGQADIFSPQGSQRLTAGQTMNARGSADDPEFQIVAAIPQDAWDKWNDDRDHYLEASRSYDHVSGDITGAEDLDQYGQWVNDPQYGSVWAPSVGQDWAPYRDGRWVWEDWYGWTWVSYDPWGWAPYHYGRWFWGARGWCWYPGPAFARHYWAPAYVGFFGWGGHVNVGFGFGGVGWVPLAPFERFHPWWGRGVYAGYRGGGFGSRSVIINNTNIAGSFRNARVNGGVTGVRSGDFGSRGGRFTSLNRGQIEQAGMVRGMVPIAPSRNSLHMSDRGVSGNYRQSSNQNFASHMQTPRVDRVGFEQQQRGMQQVSRGNFTEGANRVGTGISGGGWQRSGAPASSGSVNNSQGASRGWSRVGDPIHGTGSASGGTGSQPSAGRSVNGGWQRLNGNRDNGAGYGSPRGYGAGQPVRINPPIIRRSPSYESSPRYEAPRGQQRSVEAPRSRGNNGGGMRMSPSRSGGGGGGGNRGGGGGGNHGGGSHGGSRGGRR